MSQIARHDLEKILSFTQYLYGVKKLLRYKGMPHWDDFTPERWDSVAEHSYRMAVLATFLAPYLAEKVDLLKTLKMILIHDIVELVANDYSPMGKHTGGGGHAFDHQAFEDKYRREIAASEEIFIKLPPELGRECKELFREYINTKALPDQSTREGKFAYALDKVEAAIQIADWTGEGFEWTPEHFESSMKYLFEWSSYDPVLKEFATLIKENIKV